MSYSDDERNARTKRRLYAGQFLLVAAVWLLVHPYEGIVHDARLYVAQAIQYADPSTFQRDLFFAFGSQSSFTVFPALQAAVIAWLGVAWSSLVMLTAIHLIWLSGAAALAFSLVADYRKAAWGLVAVALLGSSYSGFGVLRYGEGFTTPRGLTEGLILWSIFFFYRSRFAACVLVAACLFLHPLNGLVGAAVLLALLLIEDRRLVLGIPVLFAILVVLVAIPVEPFGRLRQTIDAEWLAILLNADRHIFPGEWNLGTWAALALRAGAVVMMTGTIATLQARRVLLTGLLVAAGGTLAAYLAADLASNVLLTQLQMFRAAWLLVVMGNFCLGLAAYDFYHTRPNGKALLALLTLCYALAFMNVAALLAVLICAFIVFVVLRDKLWPDQALARAVIYLLTFTVSIVMLGYRITFTVEGYRELAAVGQAPLWWFFEGHVFDPLAVGLLLIAVPRKFAVRRFRFGLVIPAALLLFAMANWDRRWPWDRYLESGAGFESVQERIPAGSTVFWDEGGNRTSAGVRTFEGIKGAWLGLRRPVYISQALAAGLVFHRKTAIAYRDRALKVADVDGREYLNLYEDRKLTNRPLGPVTEDDVRKSCAAAVGLDFLILSRRADMEHAFRWRPAVPTPVAFEEGIEPAAEFFIYDCRKIRQ